MSCLRRQLLEDPELKINHSIRNLLEQLAEKDSLITELKGKIERSIKSIREFKEALGDVKCTSCSIHLLLK